MTTRLPKLILHTILAVSLTLMLGCFSLAFAGGWIGAYAYGIETLGAISTTASIILGVIETYIHRHYFLQSTRRK